jgi:hypothetical protein
MVQTVVSRKGAKTQSSDLPPSRLCAFARIISRQAAKAETIIFVTIREIRGLSIIDPWLLI